MKDKPCKARCCLCGKEYYRSYDCFLSVMHDVQKDHWLVANIKDDAGRKYQFICDICRHRHNMWKIKFDENKLYAIDIPHKMDNGKYSHDFVYSDENGQAEES